MSIRSLLLILVLTLAVPVRAGELLTLPLAIDYAVLPQDVEQPEALTAHLLRFAVDMRYKERMPREDSRRWAAILEQLYEQPKTLKMSRGDFGWLRETVEQADYPPVMASWRWTLIDHLDAVQSGLDGSKASEP